MVANKNDDQWTNVMNGVQGNRKFSIPGLIAIAQDGSVELFGGIFKRKKKKEKTDEKDSFSNFTGD